MSAPVWNLAMDVLHVGAALCAILLTLGHVGMTGASRTMMGRANAALAFTALWALASMALGRDGLAIQALVSCTYLAWLWFLYGLFSQDARDKSLAPLRPVVFSVAIVEGVQLGLTMGRIAFSDHPILASDSAEAMLSVIVMLRLLSSIGALVLVHNLYVGAAQTARHALRWPAAALAAVWLYDLNLYTVSYLADGPPAVLVDLRSVAVIVSCALLGYGTLGARADLRFQPSRSFAFRSFSLAVIGAYLMLMVTVAQAIAYAGSDFSRALQIGFVLVASAIALALLPSRKLRGWLKVTLAKHLFQHRYDYRAEWMRFTDTIGRAGPEASPLHVRAIQAVADVTDSSRGLLLTQCEEGGLTVDARWNWPGIEVPPVAMSATGMRYFEDSAFIVDLDDLRNGRVQGIPASAAPAWLVDDPDAWALIPLLHFERLVAIVVLSRPPVARRLDWEDFDLLRVIGSQLASYLAEQTTQDALGEAQRFDEFNRRIAFVMHDIKNLASQLSLLARNTEKHADKPEFRADMIITLRNSTDKLQALLARLSRYGAQGGAAMEDTRMDDLLARVAAQFTAKHQIVLLEREACTARCNPEALEQALVHLVQNAIEASAASSPVFIDLREEDNAVNIEVIDSGCGMSAEFIRSRLFKPFHSSKQGGFGIGVFEARELIRAMGGRLDVESREGIGTRFQIRLPLAATATLINALKGTPNKPSPDRNAEVA
jgi:putative PEP-CTERM system histidine kinase